MDPVASIVIVAHGKRAVTERCLATLEDALGAGLGSAFELVLVDNASPDDTPELFDRWRERATVVELPENRNFAGGCNAGAHAARGEVVVFLNNDTEAVAGALEALVEQAREPGVGAVGMRLLYPDGRIQHAGVGMIRVPSGLAVPHHFFHFLPGDLPAARLTFDLDVVTAACMAVPRELFLELGAFDEGYVNGWEDVDLCLRIRLAGHRIVYRGDLWLVHAEGMTRGRIEGADPNSERFYERWDHLLDDDSELVGGLLDGRIVPIVSSPPTPKSGGRPVVVEGHVSGVASEADEARALLGVLTAGGVEPAARDVPMAFVSPRLSDEGWAAVLAAREREIDPGALTIRVPVGSPPVPEPRSGSVVRLATMPPDGPPAGAAGIWAATPALARALVERGAPADRVAWLPPAVLVRAHGDGGDGALTILPAHEPAVSRWLLEALAGLTDTRRVRLLPTARTRELEDLAATLSPRAELLDPCADEAQFALLAASSDAVVCGDPSDRFDRRALVAAASGAPVVVLGAEGPATAVLRDDASSADLFDPASLEAALRTVLERAGGRAERSERVLATCGPGAVATRLSELLPAAQAAANADAAGLAA